MMNLDFSEQVAVITAGASGIGAATAKLFGSSGAKVVIVDIDQSGGAALAEHLAASGADAQFVLANLTRPDEASRVMQQVMARFGRLDILVNGVGGVAGGGHGALLHELTEAQWDGTLDLSLKSMFLSLKSALPCMIASKGGAIVNVASRAGMHVSVAASPVYSAAKAAMIHLTRVAAVTYAQHGIRVNAVAPGLTMTPMFAGGFENEQLEGLIGRAPIARIIDPSEPASAIAWLCSDAAAMTTGHTVPIDGGYDAL
ncbi:MAG: SDR family NAD(P)-dependent oxidoreductase [Sphingorhabdus sp.]